MNSVIACVALLAGIAYCDADVLSNLTKIDLKVKIGGKDVSIQSLQPRVITLESHPSRKASGIISMPEGSPWCGGQPAIWLPGHKDRLLDEPNCLIGGEWTKTGTAKMDIIDFTNAQDGAKVIDRHDCGVLDMNNDGVPDIYCAVGANKGRGFGWNEVYLTTKRGSLFKILRHGLQRFLGQRTRHTAVMKGANGTEYVFISATQGEREDGKQNKHAMFRKNNVFHPRWKRYFDHVRGPWQRHTNATCAISVDINQDGLEDLIVCNQLLTSYIFIQTENGWRQPLPEFSRAQRNWRNARVADMNNDGLPDLVVVYHSSRESFLRIFAGIKDYPYFNFESAWFGRHIQMAAPDIEIADVNGDGMMDIYVVQADEYIFEDDRRTRRKEFYCGGKLNPETWWDSGPNPDPIDRITPPDDFVPPKDPAHDILLMGNSKPRNGADRFVEVAMYHEEPGCGYFVKKFGESSLILAQGGFDRPGHQLLLEW